MFTKRKWFERIVGKYSMPEVYCKIANKEYDNFISSIIEKCHSVNSYILCIYGGSSENSIRIRILNLWYRNGSIKIPYDLELNRFTKEFIEEIESKLNPDYEFQDKAALAQMLFIFKLLERDEKEAIDYALRLMS
jgi:hypothetical protein|nr:MAG TPA: hypothetical protein [Caudoviricetes sp.]